MSYRTCFDKGIILRNVVNSVSITMMWAVGTFEVELFPFSLTKYRRFVLVSFSMLLDRVLVYIYTKGV